MYVYVDGQAYNARVGRCKAFLAGAVLTSGEEKAGMPVPTRPQVHISGEKASLAN
jgi:hypothetical protein